MQEKGRDGHFLQIRESIYGALDVTLLSLPASVKVELEVLRVLAERKGTPGN